MEKKITIHQPDFMPWLGLFNKISKVDEWVVLDHVTNYPRDPGWWRRVQIVSGSKAGWISVPLIWESGRVEPIREMKINWQQEKAIKKSFDTVINNYRRAPFFEDTFPLIEEYFRVNDETLKEKNMRFITTVLEKLAIRPLIIFSSELDCKSKSAELQVEILQKRQGTHYLCGAGAKGYQRDELFDQAGIRLTYNSFTPTEYPQHNTTSFVSGLSIVDALMNLGFGSVEKLVKTGV